MKSEPHNTTRSSSLNNTTRRSFLTQSAAASALLAARPFAVHAQDKSGSKLPIVGSGEHTYECHHGWGETPDHIKWYETHGCAVDKAGNVYITHRAAANLPKTPSACQDTTVVFDSKGKFVRSFGFQYTSGGHGIDIREENGQEFLYLAYMMPVNLIEKTTLTGERVWLRDKPPEPHVYDNPKARFAPTNIAFAPDGGFYLADGYGSNYIHQYDKDGIWKKTFGGTGSEQGKFRTAHGIWVDARPGREPMLVIADRANHRLQYLTLDGTPVSMDTENVSFPAHIETRGEIMMVPDLHARITLFDKNNKVITHLGYDPDWTKEVLDGMKVRQDANRWKPGKFVHPHDACFDNEGNIIVAEWVVPGRLTYLRKVGA
jgi:DNA-binding beta-propeller fold protein YncE